MDVIPEMVSTACIAAYKQSPYVPFIHAFLIPSICHPASHQPQIDRDSHLLCYLEAGPKTWARRTVIPKIKKLSNLD